MSIILKPGKEGVVKKGHPWIFSGAIAKWPSFENGALLDIYSADGDFLGKGYFNKNCSIAGRMLTRKPQAIEEILKQKIADAYALRKQLFSSSVTTAFRLINAEGDGLSGLIADLYDDILVIQISTLGMWKLRPLLIDLFAKQLPIKAIYEKSTSASLKIEGLQSKEGWIYQQGPSTLPIKEEGLNFIVDIEGGQKTGFFLDQREMRRFVGELSKGRRVLNTFAYSGGFSLYALRGGAQEVVSIDISQGACTLIDKNIEFNGFSPQRTLAIDAFDYLRADEEMFDLIILDPPAFAKRKQDEKKAFRGYKEINLQALKKLQPGGILVTCSCSYFFDESLFCAMLNDAAKDTGSALRVLSRHRQAPDHPIALAHPEGSYLKSLVVTKLA